MKTGRKRILFVGSDPSLLTELQRLLQGQQHAWEMVFATSVEQALNELEASSFDAIVAESRMPGKDGFDLLRSVQDSETHRDIPVVIVAGASEGEMKSLALNLGAADLLSMPVLQEDLLARLRSVLHLKDCRDALKAVNETLERKVAERTAELEQSRLDIIWRLAKAGEHRDQNTGFHIVRVGCYARVIAEALGLPRDSAELLFLTSPLHDIGKIGIPDSILKKPGPLTPEETRVMHDHCVIGAEILLQQPLGVEPFFEWRGTADSDARLGMASNRLLAMAASIALTHHERWDGRGYPCGLIGDNIPLDGRIAALADAYDAICSERPYKEPVSEDEACEILKPEAGKHFDPSVFAAFSRAKRQIREIRARYPDEAFAPPDEIRDATQFLFC